MNCVKQSNGYKIDKDSLNIEIVRECDEDLSPTNNLYGGDRGAIMT